MTFDSLKLSMIEDRALEIPVEDYATVFYEAEPKALLKLSEAYRHGTPLQLKDAFDEILKAYEAKRLTDEEVEEVMSDIEREEREPMRAWA